MPRVQITPTIAVPAGATPVAEANGDNVNGHYVDNRDGKTIVVVRNADAGAPHSVTFVTTATLGGFAVADQTVSIPASSSREFGGFDTRLFGKSLQIDVDSTQLKLQAKTAG